MMSKIEEVQRRWQAAALEVLLAQGGQHDRGPWVPAVIARKEIEVRAGCSTSAANGALVALRTVGVAALSETDEGRFWRATEASERIYDLMLAPLHAEVSAIGDRLEGIDVNLNTLLLLQEIREKLS